MSVSYVRRRAPKQVIGYRVRDDSYVNEEGKTVVIHTKIPIRRLVQPLKQWVREQIATEGQHHLACSEWLAKKNGWGAVDRARG